VARYRTFHEYLQAFVELDRTQLQEHLKRIEQVTQVRSEYVPEGEQTSV
jgi:hypothetical protein